MGTTCKTPEDRRENTSGLVHMALHSVNCNWFDRRTRCVWGQGGVVNHIQFSVPKTIYHVARWWGPGYHNDFLFEILFIHRQSIWTPLKNLSSLGLHDSYWGSWHRSLHVLLNWLIDALEQLTYELLGLPWTYQILKHLTIWRHL